MRSSIARSVFVVVGAVFIDMDAPYREGPTSQIPEAPPRDFARLAPAQELLRSPPVRLPRSAAAALALALVACVGSSDERLADGAGNGDADGLDDGDEGGGGASPPDGECVIA